MQFARAPAGDGGSGLGWLTDGTFLSWPEGEECFQQSLQNFSRGPWAKQSDLCRLCYRTIQIFFSTLCQFEKKSIVDVKYHAAGDNDFMWGGAFS